MKILYIVPWPVPFDKTNLQDIVNTQFGYYTLKEKDVDITWLTHNRNGVFYKLCKVIRMPQLNQIFSQLSVIGKERDYDVIYVGFDMHLLPLAILKLLGLVRKPVFVLSHFSYNTQYTQSLAKKVYKRIERALVYRTINKITFASEKLMSIAQKDYKVPARHANYVDWGSNLRFFNKLLYTAPPSLNYFVAAGGMNRDYATLIEAFARVPEASVRIYAKYKDYTKGNPLPPNVTFGNLMKDKSYHEAFEALRSEYYHAIAILLPIDYINDVPNGATVLVEALAMGKPIIITAAETNLIDVEDEDVGMTVASHDVEGWVKTIRFLLEHPERVREMGENSYRLAMTRYNDEKFVDKLIKQMEDLYEATKK